MDLTATLTPRNWLISGWLFNSESEVLYLGVIIALSGFLGQPKTSFGQPKLY